MGYACPVCETPQADARHLANHLAFTAMLGREDHRAWLDEHAPGWEASNEQELAERVEREAKEVEFPQVFEDTAGGLDGEHAHDHDPAEERSGALFDDEGDLPDRGPAGGHGHDHGGGHDRGGGGAAGAAPMDEEAQEILEEAREMTRQMMEEAERNEEPDDESESEAADGEEGATDGSEDADDTDAEPS